MPLLQDTQTHPWGNVPARKALLLRGLQETEDSMRWQFYCSWPAGALTHKNEGIRMCANREQRNEAYLLACRVIPQEAVKRLQNQSLVKLNLQLIRPNKGAWIESEIAERCEGLIQGIANALCTNRFQLEYTMEDPPMKPGGVRVTVTELEFFKSAP